MYKGLREAYKNAKQCIGIMETKLFNGLNWLFGILYCLGTDYLTCRRAMSFFSLRIFFSDNTRVRILIFLSYKGRFFFLQNLTLGYMTKTLNQIIIFFLHQNQNIFSATLGIRIFFLEKTYSPPLPPGS